ncbi:MAG: sugar transferase [Nitrospira sp.]|nr:sugar transferase [Nitrospira sp.]HQY56610.1 sugar transferase [Nitrospira sp.]
MIKRGFDILISTLGIVLLAPVFVTIALLVRIDSPGPAFFRQERIGRHFRPFKILKFRTMMRAKSDDLRLTVGEDSRITEVGRWLRRSKLDELPQLFNVVAGDMSLVGPRPEIPRYVEMFRKDYEELLTVRPGITDTASIVYRDEAAILGRAQDADQVYVTMILPEKIRLAKNDLRRSSVFVDIFIIVKTLMGTRRHG